MQDYLAAMGAKISGAGSDTLTIEGFAASGRAVCRIIICRFHFQPRFFRHQRFDEIAVCKDVKILRLFDIPFKFALHVIKSFLCRTLIESDLLRR